jgi:hypothetical protein
MISSCVLGLKLLADLLHFLVLNLRSKSSLVAENLFLRKQLAFWGCWLRLRPTSQFAITILTIGESPALMNRSSRVGACRQKKER